MYIDTSNTASGRITLNATKADSANKLNTDAGSSTNPVYFASGIPVKTTYTLNASVPSNAKFTDTNHYHSPTHTSGVKIGTGNGISDLYVPNASATSAGVTIVYPESQCTTFTSDLGTVTPAAVKKAVTTFGVLKAGSTMTGALTMSNQETLQSKQPFIKWKTIGSNTPTIGFAQDQTDGTFVICSMSGTNSYKNGLAIGGGSGNLLWKGNKILVSGDAELNQNAFSNIKVDSTTIAADTKTDTLTLVGNNVTLTPDATNDKITIGITKSNVTTALGYTPPTSDTTYSAATTSTAGLMSAADKIKLDGIATGATANTGDITGVTAGTGLSGGGSSGNVTLSLGTIGTAGTYGPISNVTGSNGNTIKVPQITTDAYGRVTSVTERTYTSVNTNTTYSLSGALSGNTFVSTLTPSSGNATTSTVPAATTTTAGLMSAADKEKLNNIATGANKYSLPAATSSALGGVKIGNNINNSSGTISITSNNITSALGYEPLSLSSFDALTIPYLNVERIRVRSDSGGGNLQGGIYCSDTDSSSMYIRNYDADSVYYENFLFPTVERTSQGTDYNYHILTDKNAITIEQGGTGSTDRYDAAQSLRVLSLANMAAEEGIAEGTDLNTLIIPGTYVAKTSSVTQSLINAPSQYNGTGFRLIVSSNLTSTSVFQVAIFNASTGLMFIRWQTNTDTWTPWRKILTSRLSSTEYGSSLPSTGETGQIFFKKV